MHQAIIWSNDRILLIGPLETYFSEILIKIHTFSFKKMHLEMVAMSRPQCDKLVSHSTFLAADFKFKMYMFWEGV